MEPESGRGMIPARLSDNGAGEISAPLLFVTWRSPGWSGPEISRMERAGDLSGGAGQSLAVGIQAVGRPAPPLGLFCGCRLVAVRLPGGLAAAPPRAPFPGRGPLVWSGSWCAWPRPSFPRASACRPSGISSAAAWFVLGGVVRRPPRIAWVAPPLCGSAGPVPFAAARCLRLAAFGPG